MIVLGIISTFSRTGILLLGLFYIFNPILKYKYLDFKGKRVIFKTLRNIIILVIGSTLIYFLLPSEIGFMVERFNSALTTLTTVFSGEQLIGTGHLSSADARFLLAASAFK